LRKTAVAAVAFLVLLSLYVFAQDENVGAKVYLENDSFDFGWIPTGGTVAHAFTLYSHGTDSLKILKVRPG
jgi:hypothetical protein